MKRLEHIGIAVEDAGPALDLWRQLFGRRPYKSESVETEGVRTHFLEAGGAKIELLEALTDASPIAGFLEKRGPGLHHVAFEVDDVDAEAARLGAAGFRVLGAVRDGADGKRIVFIHPRDTGGVLVELCASARRADRDGDGPVDAPSVVVPPGRRNDPFAAALSRKHRVERSSARGPLAAAVSPSPEWMIDAAEYDRVVLVSPSVVPEALRRASCLVVSTDGSAAPSGCRGVALPRPLLEGLPDPWSTVADLASGHLNGR